jgi:potassium efflux system protein
MHALNPLRFCARTIVLPILIAAIAAAARPAAGQTTQSQPASKPATEPTSQPTAPPEVAADPTPERVQRLIRELEEGGAIDEGLKTELLKVYRDALAELNRARDFESATLEFKRAADQAPERLARLRTEIEALPAEPDVRISPDATPAAAAQELASAEAELSEKDAALTSIEAEQRRREERRVKVPERVASLRPELAALAEAPGPEKPDEAPALREARRLLRQCRRLALTRELASLESELPSYVAQAEVMNALREGAARRRSLADKLVKKRHQAVLEINDRAARIAADEAQRAREEAARAIPVVAAVLTENAKLAEEKTRLAEKQRSATAARAAVREEFAHLQSQDKPLRSIVAQLGATADVGRRLREQRRLLPNPRVILTEIRKRDGEIGAAQFNQFEIDNQRRALIDSDQEVSDVIARVETERRDEARELAVRLFQTQRRYLDELHQSLGDYIGTLSETTAEQRGMLTRSQSLATFIDENVLWIQSAPPIWTVHPGELLKALGRFFEPRDWLLLAAALRDDALLQPAPWSMALLTFLALFVGQVWLRRWLRALAEPVARAATDRFLYTVRAIVITLLLSCMWPGLLAFLAWRLSLTAIGNHQAAVAEGLGRLALAWFVIGAQLIAGRTGGLAESHFRWRPNNIRTLRRHLAWFFVTFMPAVFIFATIDARDEDAELGSLGRIAFIFGMLMLALFAFRVLRPVGGVVEDVLSKNRSGWLSRLRYLWFPLVVGLPLVLAGLAVLGYAYTAYQFELRFARTFLLALILIYANAIVLRFFFVSQRRIALGRAQKSLDRGETPAVAADSQEMNLLVVSSQSRDLLHSGLAFAMILGICLIWQDTLPAWNFLRGYVVIPAEHVAALPAPPDGSAATPGAAPALARPLTEAAGAVTLADILLAIVIAIVTVMVSKNLPGLMEIVVLSRLPLEPSVRYAITAISRYSITIVGIVIACGSLGVGWSKVQWLAAAVTFGLGFGLQEIFANFVSGLILLFERPIRVGDIVTVGDTSGVVSRIRIRATTITDFDNKILVVPNKEFIVGRVVNWTLTSRSLRLILKLGVAYGADTELARSILVRIAQQSPYVAVEPPPVALFTGFGDSTLNMELQVHLRDLSDGGEARSRLNAAIAKAFQEAGIELAFPQHDVNVRLADPEVVQTLRDALKQSVQKPEV